MTTVLPTARAYRRHIRRSIDRGLRNSEEGNRERETERRDRGLALDRIENACTRRKEAPRAVMERRDTRRGTGDIAHPALTYRQSPRCHLPSAACKRAPTWISIYIEAHRAPPASRRNAETFLKFSGKRGGEPLRSSVRSGDNDFPISRGRTLTDMAADPRLRVNYDARRRI